MRKKQIALLLAIVLSISCFVGCSSESGRVEVKEPEIEPIEEIVEEPVEEPVEEIKELTGITQREVVNGEMQSYLTGEWTSEEVATRRPIAVMIPNNSPAMPQYGLSQAGIIYEAPVEGRITRIMAVIENFDELDRVGPVRSARDYFLYTALGYDAIFCNWGLARPYVEELINRDNVHNVSAAVEGIYKPADEAYARVPREGYSLEFTGYLMMDGLFDAVDRLGYNWNYSEGHVPQFLFANDMIAEYAENEDATMIYPGGKSGDNASGYGAYHPYFEYHADDHLYYRYQNGEPQIDEYNGEQLTFTNVVLQYCHGEVRDDHDYLAFGMHDEGQALIFTNGKVIPCTWSRLAGDSIPARFYDATGQEVIVNQGKTWICTIWDEYSEYVEYE